MMAILCSRAFYADDPIVLSILPSSQTRRAERRLSRTPTLDGGVAVTDGGFAAGDDTLILRLADISTTTGDAIAALAQRALSVSLAHGVFAALIQSYTLGASPTVTLAVTEELT